MTSVALKIDDRYYDDSSNALGLARRAEDGSFKGRGIAAFDAAERAKIAAGRRERIQKRVRELVRDGHTIKQAREAAEQEIDNPTVLKPLGKEERDLKHERAVRHLMGEDMDVAGGSSGAKSKFKSRKTGTRVCPNCHLEGCQCYQGPGRPPLEHARTKQVGCKVSDRVHDFLEGKAVEISAGLIVDTVVTLAIEHGVTRPRDVIKMLEQLKPIDNV